MVGPQNDTMKVREAAVIKGRHRRHHWYKWYLSLSIEQIKQHYISNANHCQRKPHYNSRMKKYIQADKRDTAARSARWWGKGDSSN